MIKYPHSHIENKKTESGDPIVVPEPVFEIQVTGKCNFNCEMCFDRFAPKCPDMSLNEFKKIIDGIDDLRKSTFLERK